MKKVFGDTFYFLALLNKNDDSHARAVQFGSTFSGIIVTTEWVLIELADGLACSSLRKVVSQVRQELLSSAHSEVIPLDMGRYEEGLALYSSRLDKEWSLTDCISFVAMKREGITDALTADRHFEQAGFNALLK